MTIDDCVKSIEICRKIHRKNEYSIVISQKQITICFPVLYKLTPLNTVGLQKNATMQTVGIISI